MGEHCDSTVAAILSSNVDPGYLEQPKAATNACTGLADKQTTAQLLEEARAHLLRPSSGTKKGLQKPQHTAEDRPSVGNVCHISHQTTLYYIPATCLDV